MSSPDIWYDPNGPTVWLKHPVPGEVIPGEQGEDWGMIASRTLWGDPSTPGFNNINQGRLLGSATNSHGFIPGIVEIEQSWSCAYCGGLRSAALHQCPGCGASRRHA